VQVQPPHVGRVLQQRMATELEAAVTAATAVVAGEQAHRRTGDAVVQLAYGRGCHQGDATAARMPAISRGEISWRCSSYTGW
jgi:hypothetical protein